jgi:hypothetical protein
MALLCICLIACSIILFFIVLFLAITILELIDGLGREVEKNTNIQEYKEIAEEDLNRQL